MRGKVVLVTIFFFGGYSTLEQDYYWREYFGSVPEDAVLAGQSIDGKNIHIGQVYVKDAGLLVGQITPGVKEVYAIVGGFKKYDKYIKILCGLQENFYWMKANASGLDLEMTGKHAVLGGHKDTYGYMNIGRISDSGNVKIGKVNSFWLENAWFYYSDNNGLEKLTRSYEILMYKNDYYWREYLGSVPEDAVVGGKSSDGKNIHIGQVYVKDEGLVVGQITPGVKEVYATTGGSKKFDKYIKILCGLQKNFYWMKANASGLHLEVTDKPAVLGGHEDTYGYMNIGRISHPGDVKIGKVNSFWLENALFYYNDNGVEKLQGTYEILMYKTGSGKDVRIEVD